MDGIGHPFGTEGRNRTDTPVKEPDFESGASTSSATPAQKAGDYSRAFLGLSARKTGYLVVIFYAFIGVKVPVTLLVLRFSCVKPGKYLF